MVLIKVREFGRYRYIAGASVVVCGCCAVPDSRSVRIEVRRSGEHLSRHLRRCQRQQRQARHAEVEQRHLRVGLWPAVDTQLALYVRQTRKKLVH